MNNQIIDILKNGGVGVYPTDTLYGLVGSALKKEVVERVYTLRKRDTQKPMIILISSLDDLKLFNINPDPKTLEFLKGVWPGKVSVVLDCPEEKFEYLHRGTKTLALRVPDKEDLRKLLEQTGPLVAPSANLEGQSESKTIQEARSYFRDQIDFYQDEGVLDSQPSTLVQIRNGQIKVLRKGAVKPDVILNLFQDPLT